MVSLGSSVQWVQSTLHERFWEPKVLGSIETIVSQKRELEKWLGLSEVRTLVYAAHAGIVETGDVRSLERGAWQLSFLEFAPLRSSLSKNK